MNSNKISLKYLEDGKEKIDGEAVSPDSLTSNHSYTYGSIQRPLSSLRVESSVSLLSMCSVDEKTELQDDGIFLLPLNDTGTDDNSFHDEENTVLSEYTLSSKASLLSAWLPVSKVEKGSHGYFSPERMTSRATNNTYTDEVIIKDKCPPDQYNSIPFYLRMLGFDNNPLAHSPDLRLAMISNLSTSFNVINISIALEVMLSGDLYLGKSNATTQSICSSALIAGMMIGQLIGGAIGDAIGRHLAMTLVMILQIVASIGSAASFPMFGTFSIFDTLAIWRFFLGIGCGGVYPLAATLTAESTTRKESRGKLVALTFSMQGLGYIFVPITSLVLIKMLGENNDWTWRLLLGIGAVPGLVQIWLRQVHRFAKQRKTDIYKEEVIVESDSMNKPKENKAIHIDVELNPESVGILSSILKEKNICRKLCGTAGTWFLFDVLFYGNTLFSRVVLREAFGSAETITSSVLDTLIVTLIALPGYFISVARIGTKETPRYIQIQGFAIMAILYFIIGTMFTQLARWKFVLLLLYGSTFLFANFGPNSTTFMLPSMTFSAGCRSTLNGISAAAGKFGALLGASCFEPVAEALGDPSVMIVCACISIFSLFMTSLCVDASVGQGKRSDVDKMPPSNGKKKKEASMNNVIKKARQSSPSLLDWQ